MKRFNTTRWLIFSIITIFILTFAGCGNKEKNEEVSPESLANTTQSIDGRRSLDSFDSRQAVEFLEWLKEVDPEKYKDLKELKDYDFIAFQKVVVEGIRHKQFLEKLRFINPEKYNELREEIALEGKLRKALDKFREMSAEKQPEKLATTREEMINILSRLFEIRMKNYYTRLELLRDQIEGYENLLKMRKKNKDLIIKQKLADLIENENLPAYSWEINSLESDFSDDFEQKIAEISTPSQTSGSRAQVAPPSGQAGPSSQATPGGQPPSGGQAAPGGQAPSAGQPPSGGQAAPGGQFPPGGQAAPGGGRFMGPPGGGGSRWQPNNRPPGSQGGPGGQGGGFVPPGPGGNQ